MKKKNEDLGSTMGRDGFRESAFFPFSFSRRTHVLVCHSHAYVTGRLVAMDSAARAPLYHRIASPSHTRPPPTEITRVIHPARRRPPAPPRPRLSHRFPSVCARSNNPSPARSFDRTTLYIHTAQSHRSFVRAK